MDENIQEWKTIKVRFQDTVCFIQFNRPEVNNTLNALVIEEISKVIMLCENEISIIVFEGSEEVFCFGGDFNDIHSRSLAGQLGNENPEQTYKLWLKLATGPYITISHVRGKANAGGIGFVASSDIVLANETAQFSLSELLFGLFPAMVLPFLIRKIGFQKAHYLSLMTKPVSVQQASEWGLVDTFHEKSDVLLKQHLLRLKNLNKKGIFQYKEYIGKLSNSIFDFQSLAVSTNREIFSNPENLERIFRFVEKGKYPWEK